MPPAGTVLAHAELLEVVPADGAVLPVSPAGITLRFSEDVSLVGGSTRLLDDTGDVVADDATVEGDTVRLPLPAALAEGTYTVSWAIISQDSHRISGASVFHVGAPSAEGPVGDGGGDDELPWSLRAGTTLLLAIGYAAALLAVGVAWFATVVARVRDHEVPAWRALVRKAAVVGVVAMLVALPARAARLGGGIDALGDDTFISETLRGPLGISTLVTVVGLVALAASVGVRGDGSEPLAVGTGLVALVGFTIEGHTRTTDPGWLMVGFDVVHLAAAAIWVGGIAGLVLAFRSALEPARLARFVRRFSTWALGTVVALAVAGTVMSIVVLPAISDLWSTGYGLVLVAKVALVAVVVAVGGYNRRWLVPAVDGASAAVSRRRLARSVRIELGLLLGVVLLTAVLVGRSPTESEAATVPPVPAAAEAPLSGTDGTATLSALPTRTGYFETSLTLRDAAGEPIVPVEPPTVQLTEPALGLGPLEVEVHELAQGEYHVFGEVPVPGTWEVEVAARITDFDLANAAFTTTVG